jgi:hypothetical protein
MLLVDRLMHADLVSRRPLHTSALVGALVSEGACRGVQHPGNILININGGPPQLILVDAGMVSPQNSHPFASVPGPPFRGIVLHRYGSPLVNAPPSHHPSGFVTLMADGRWRG